MDVSSRITAFLAGAPHAVVGASTDRDKYGNKCLRCYQQAGRPVFPINPRGGEVEGLASYSDLASLPEVPHGVTVVTPPAVTLHVLEEAASLGVQHVWLQPGAESPEVVERALELGLEPISGGPCLLVALGYTEADVTPG